MISFVSRKAASEKSKGRHEGRNAVNVSIYVSILLHRKESDIPPMNEISFLAIFLHTKTLSIFLSFHLSFSQSTQHHLLSLLSLSLIIVLIPSFLSVSLCLSLSICFFFLPFPQGGVLVDNVSLCEEGDGDVVCASV